MITQQQRDEFDENFAEYSQHEFERAFSNCKLDRTPMGGEYTHPYVQHAWEGWYECALHQHYQSA